MLVYILLMLVTVGLLYLSTNNKRLNDVILWADCGVLIMLLALRANTCADDTQFYYEYFISSGWWGGRFEFLYDLLNKVVYSISGNFQMLLLCNASLSIIPVFYLLAKHKNRHIYVFLYQALTLYAFNFAIMRQTIAMSFVLLAFASSYERYGIKIHPEVEAKRVQLSGKLIATIRGAMLMSIAVLFHNTAIIFAPLLLIDYVKWTHKRIGVISVATVLIFFFREPILKTVFGIFFPDKMNVYLRTFELDFGVVPVTLFCVSILGYLVLQKVYHVKQSVQTRILAKAVGYSLYIAVCLCWIPATGRLNQYGYLLVMFLLGNLYESLADKTPLVAKINALTYLLGTVYYVWQLWGNIYNIIPYYTFVS